MLVVETSRFTTELARYLSDEEYRQFQTYLMARPEAGALIRGLGGIRVIYYWASGAAQIYLLTVYGKSERPNIDKATLRQIAGKLELLK